MLAILKDSHIAVEYDGILIYENYDIEKYEKFGNDILIIQSKTHITLLSPYFVFDVQNAIYWNIYKNHLFVVRNTDKLITCAIYDKNLEQIDSWQYIGKMWCVIYNIKAWVAPYYITGWNQQGTTGIIKNIPYRISIGSLSLEKILEKQLIYNLNEIFVEDFSEL